MRSPKLFSRLLLSILLFLTPGLCFSQVTQQWARTYNSPDNGDDEATALIVDSSGNIYVTRYSQSWDNGNQYALLKYDTAGKILWEKTYSGDTSFGGNLAVDASGNVYATGTSKTDEYAQPDYAVVKYDKDGKELWMKTYDGPEHEGDYPTAIAVDALGNVYVTGISSGKESSWDYATIKYDKNGNMQWVKRYNGPGNSDDHVIALAVDASGNVYITGYSESADGVTAYNYDYATIKYDTNGKEQWVKRYNGPGNRYDIATALTIDKLGNVYVTGRSQMTKKNLDDDYATIKYDTYGTEVWVKYYDGPGHSQDGAVSVAVDKHGNVYVTGSSAEDIAENEYNVFDYATVKYDSSGKQLWAQRYNDPGADQFVWQLALDTAANVYVTGISGSYYTTIKYGNDGSEAWITKYNTGASNQFEPPVFLAVDLQSNLYVAGAIGSEDDESSFDFALIKYVQAQSIWYRDADGDGWGNPYSSKVSLTQPKGYVSNKLDCDDKNKTRGGPEVCDGRDNDCDGIIDNGFDKKPFYSDWDADGYGSPKRMKMACAAPPEYVSNDGDCNDDLATVHPGAPELCDGRDNDCNGKIDDGLSQKPFYWDHDKDGYGFFRPVYACAAPRGYIAQGGDFNDNDPSIHPGAVEHCDGVDEDCDGVIDNGFPQKRFYKDKDGDGWGSNSNEMAGCAPKGYVERNGDCDDNNKNIHPGTTEIPGNGIDDNCNGQVDEIITTAVTLYGITRGLAPEAGGGSGANRGTIYSFHPSDSNVLKWWNFSDGGSTPSSSLVKAKDGKLYSTTEYGGAQGNGVLFSFDPNTATYKKVWDFDEINGKYPSSTLVETADGKLYGMADGGTNDNGVLFSFDPLTATFVKLLDFDGTNGNIYHYESSPQLLKASNGKLYGLTTSGGSHNLGVLFSFDPVSADYTKLVDFDGINGSNPYPALLQAHNGKIYGTAIDEASKDRDIMYALDPTTGKYSKVAAFDSINGVYIQSMMQTRDGKFYGTTFYGGAEGQGIIFSFDPSTSVLKRLYDFKIADGFTLASTLMQASDGKLYGTTLFGGTNEGGVLFTFDPVALTYKKLWDFPQEEKGGDPLGQLIEYEPACKQITYYQDQDKDGFGNGKVKITLASCTPPQGYVATAGDCNDKDASINPEASEFNCDGKDNNCNGLVDEDGECGGVLTKAEKKVALQDGTILHLSAHPNPSQNYFSLRIEGKTGKTVQLRIVDAVGRLVEVRQGITPNSTLTIGYNYRPGFYYVEAVQEGKKATIKLVKTTQ